MLLFPTLFYTNYICFLEPILDKWIREHAGTGSEETGGNTSQSSWKNEWSFEAIHRKIKGNIEIIWYFKG